MTQANDSGRSSAVATISQMLCERALECPERVLLSFPDQELTYREMLRRAKQLAKGLFALGLRAGDHVAILMPNCLDFMVISFAAHLLRAVPVPINARFKRRELSFVIAHSDVKMVFTTDLLDEFVDFTALLWDSLPSLTKATGSVLALEEAPALRSVVVCGHKAQSPALSLEDVVAKGAAIPDAAIDAIHAQAKASDLAFLLYTSGTTAVPKGCEITHDSVVRSWIAYADTVDLRAGEWIWAPCPFFHVGGIGPMVAALDRGASMATAARFEAKAAILQIEKLRIEHLFPAFPQLTLGVVRAPEFDAARFGFMRTVLNVAPPETQKLIQSLLPAGTPLITDFGMTEGAGMVTITQPGDSLDMRTQTNGRQYPGIEVRIADPVTNVAVPAMERGEIQFRGINAFRAYYKDAEATRATILPGGWVKTGDLGMMDEHASLFFIGRIKDILKVGGENVAPAEVEAHLSTHPSVKMAQVVGKPDERYGELPVAFVELMPGKTADAETLMAHCRGQLANFKIPREVRFITEWPMSATKIQKFKLREMLLASVPREA